MHWYNPTKRVEEDIPTPNTEAQATGLLSWHPNCSEFVEEYTKQRRANDVVKALILTGETFYQEHRSKRLQEE